MGKINEKRRIKVVTDSTAYLPQHLVDKHDIHVVSLRVHFGEERGREVDMDPSAFYEKLERAEELPTTSSPPSGEFEELFTRLTNEGHSVICITISSRLSSTYESAKAAHKSLPQEAARKVAVVDSLSSVGGLALMVVAAVRMAEEGVPLEEAVERLEKIRDNSELVLMVDTLEHLRKGGRIGAATAFIGTLLKIKPVLILIDGVVNPLDKVRTRNKAIKRMVDEMEARVDASRPVVVWVMHTCCPQEAEILAREVTARFDRAEIFEQSAGPVVGTHVGPRGMGLAFYQEPL